MLGYERLPLCKDALEATKDFVTHLCRNANLSHGIMRPAQPPLVRQGLAKFFIITAYPGFCVPLFLQAPFPPR